MKALILTSFFLFFMTSFTAPPELPSKIKTYTEKHFPGKKLTKYKTEWTPEKGKYKVYLDYDVKIEFDGDYNPIEIDGKGGLPDSVIPDKLLKYSKENYPDRKIIEWEKSTYKNKQEIELDNGIELEFDLKGNFLRID